MGLFYDPMLAKLIVWAATRDAAVERMHRALLELTVDGVETSREFHLRVMEDAEFRSGAIDIQWLERRLPSLLGGVPSRAALEAAAVAAALVARHESRGRSMAPAASGPADVASGAGVGEWAALARREGLRES